MHQLLTLLLFLCSFCGFSQLYVADDLVFSLVSSETVFTTQETVNTINSSIHGEGFFYLNSSQSQNLNSSSDFTRLPNLRLQNADLVDITMRVDIQHALIIDSGTLLLSTDLYLQDATALLIFGNGTVSQTALGQLVFKSQITPNDFSLTLDTSTTLLFSLTHTVDIIEVSELFSTLLSHFERGPFIFKSPYLNLSSPPPKRILA
ncbi:MAG: Uncharacterised protein [Formosa sp. Hel1_33_131]|nr:MAG: Uncharacterised protein [Formosa sp. Hel1_33_131]